MGGSGLTKTYRVPELDILKRLGILMMIVDHVKFGNNVTHFVRSFHMPLFFVISGFLWRERGESVIQRLKQRAKKLLLPYFAFGVFFCGIWTAIDLFRGDYSEIARYWRNLFLFSNQGLPFSGPLWFFPCMVLADLFFIFLYRLSGRIIGPNASDRKRKISFGVLVAAVAILGSVYSAINSLPVLIWSCEPALTAIFFMYFGFILRRFHDKAKIDLLILRPLPLVLLFCIASTLAMLNPTINMRVARYCIVPLYFFNGCLQTVVWLNFSRVLLRLSDGNGFASRITKPVKRLLSYLSLDSISFVCMNYALVSIFAHFIPRLPLPSSRSFSLLEDLVVLALVIVIITIINELIKRTPLRIILGK